MNIKNTSPQDAADKLLGVELLRFACAVAVLVFHFQHFAFVGLVQPGFVGDQQPFYPALRLFYQYGFYGVQVFWAISGFIFYWKYAAELSSRKVGGYPFFILRLSRLYPLHLATLLFMVAAQWLYFRTTQQYFVYAHNDAYHFGLQLFMASNWGLQMGDSFNGPIWSISIEVLVYALFFFGLRYLSASPWFLIGILGAAILVTAAKLSSHPFFYCVIFFYAGCLTAVAYNHVSRNHRWRIAATSIAVAVVAVMQPLLYRSSVRPLEYLLLCSPAVILLSVLYIRPRTVGESALVAAGNITYASYLLHVPIQIVVCWLFATQAAPVPWRSPTFFLVYIIGTLVLSLWCYKSFEMPMQRLTRRSLLSR